MLLTGRFQFGLDLAQADVLLALELVRGTLDIALGASSRSACASLRLSSHSSCFASWSVVVEFVELAGDRGCAQGAPSGRRADADVPMRVRFSRVSAMRPSRFPCAAPCAGDAGGFRGRTRSSSGFALDDASEIMPCR